MAPPLKEVLRDARGQVHAFSQHRVFLDEGCLQSMFETPYWWTHEAMMNSIITDILDAMCERAKWTPSAHITADAVKSALFFSHVRLARGYNVLDVEISRGAWKGREGKQVRATVGIYGELPSRTAFSTERLLRACVGPVIYCDTAGLHCAKFRDVFHSERVRRYRAWKKLVNLFEHMERQGLVAMVQMDGQWPCFVKCPRSSAAAQEAMRQMRLPFFHLPHTSCL